MRALKKLSMVAILCGAVLLLFAALNRDDVPQNEGPSELSVTAEPAAPVDSPTVASSADEQVITDDIRTTDIQVGSSGDSIALGGPILPDEPAGASAVLDELVELIQSQPSEEYTFEPEPIDPNWAPGMESTIWSAASVLGEVREVECRTTYCRAILSPLESDSASVEGFPSDEFLADQRVMSETFNAVIKNSNRLNGFSVSVPIPSELQSADEIVVTLSGSSVEDSSSTPR